MMMHTANDRSSKVSEFKIQMKCVIITTIIIISFGGSFAVVARAGKSNRIDSNVSIAMTCRMEKSE